MEEEKSIIALKGNGSGEDITQEQLEAILKLRHDPAVNKIANDVLVEIIDENGAKVTKPWIDYDVCRRFLVARTWIYNDALDQLVSVLHWRIKAKYVDISFPLYFFGH